MSRRYLAVCCLFLAGCLSEEPPPQLTPTVENVIDVLHDPQDAPAEPVLSLDAGEVIAAKVIVDASHPTRETKHKVHSTFQTPAPNTMELIFEGADFESPYVEVIWEESDDPTNLGEFVLRQDRLSKSVASATLDKVGTPIEIWKVGGMPLHTGPYQSAIAVVWLCSKDPYYAATVRDSIRQSPVAKISPREAIVAILEAEKGYQALVTEDELQPQE